MEPPPAVRLNTAALNFAAAVKIARPLLLITTPIGIVAGLREAWRFHWWLAVLMAVLLAVLGALFYYTWRVIRRESD